MSQFVQDKWGEMLCMAHAPAPGCALSPPPLTAPMSVANVCGTMTPAVPCLYRVPCVYLHTYDGTYTSMAARSCTCVRVWSSVEWCSCYPLHADRGEVCEK